MPRPSHRRQSILRPRRPAAPPLRFSPPVTLLVCLLGLTVLRGMATNEVFHDTRTTGSQDIDTDTEDRQRPGVDAIVEAGIPKKDGKGAMVLVHDAGGDRPQTVQAAGTLIDTREKRHHHFGTVGEALGSPDTTVKVHGYQLRAGKAHIWATRSSVGLRPWLVSLLAVAGGLVFGRSALMPVLATIHVRRTRKPGFGWGPPVTEPVTVLVPACNEQECVANTLHSPTGGRLRWQKLRRTGEVSAPIVEA